VTILTGSGSGKTTLVNRILKDSTGMYRVIENEFGGLAWTTRSAERSRRAESSR